MIESLRVRGAAGSILWGYREIASLGPWAILRVVPPQVRQPGVKLVTPTKGLRLAARVIRADSFQIRQRPLYFTAARVGGLWCFPVLDEPTLERGVLRAALGPPEG